MNNCGMQYVIYAYYLWFLCGCGVDPWPLCVVELDMPSWQSWPSCVVELDMPSWQSWPSWWVWPGPFVAILTWPSWHIGLRGIALLALVATCSWILIWIIPTAQLEGAVRLALAHLETPLAICMLHYICLILVLSCDYCLLGLILVLSCDYCLLGLILVLLCFTCCDLVTRANATLTRCKMLR